MALESASSIVTSDSNIYYIFFILKYRFSILLDTYFIFLFLNLRVQIHTIISKNIVKSTYNI